MSAWTSEERQRFEAGVIEALDDAGIVCRPVPGSLRVTLGGSIVTGAAAVVTWVADAGKLRHWRSELSAGEIGAILHRAAGKLNGSDPAGG